MSKVILSLGSNMGDRAMYLEKAQTRIEAEVGPVLRRTLIKETKSWGYDSHDYLNQLLEVQTEMPPAELLACLKTIELHLDRTPESKTKPGTMDYQDRTIDIDILYYDELHLNTPDLVIPHPRIRERTFLLELLKELDEKKNEKK